MAAGARPDRRPVRLAGAGTHVRRRTDLGCRRRRRPRDQVRLNQPTVCLPNPFPSVELTCESGRLRSRHVWNKQRRNQTRPKRRFRRSQRVSFSEFQRLTERSLAPSPAYPTLLARGDAFVSPVQPL